jgi:regulator of protease activity HflC (stomatin/prohibitin superfamily)
MFKKIKVWLTGSTVAIVLIILVLFVALFSITVVDEREVAVITQFGRVQTTYNAGLNFKLPLIQRTHFYDISTQSVRADAISATNDQQMVNIVVNIQYRLQPENVNELHKKVKNEEILETSIIPPFVQEATKSISAQFTAVELLQKRDDYKSMVTEALESRLSEYYVSVIAVNIENIDFSEDFDRAIERKVIAQQEAEKAEFELEKEKAELEKEKVKADAIRVKGQALKDNPQVLEQQKIEKWDGKLPQVTSGEGVIIDLNN